MLRGPGDARPARGADPTENGSALLEAGLLLGYVPPGLHPLGLCSMAHVFLICYVEAENSVPQILKETAAMRKGRL